MYEDGTHIGCCSRVLPMLIPNPEKGIFLLFIYQILSINARYKVNAAEKCIKAIVCLLIIVDLVSLISVRDKKSYMTWNLQWTGYLKTVIGLLMP